MFCDTFSILNLVKDYTCFTKTNKSFDLILTNKEHSFQSTKTTETGISDVHLLISTFMKAQTKLLPQKRLCSEILKTLTKQLF